MRRSWSRRSWSGAVLAVAVAVATACGGEGPTDGTPPPPAPPPPAPPPPMVPGADVTINVDDIAFIDPDGGRNENATVTIQVGQTVGWENNDDVAHTVTSGEGVGGSDGDGLPAGAEAFDMPLGIGDEITITFDVAGTYTYFCEIHPGQMFNATIIVEE